MTNRIRIYGHLGKDAEIKDVNGKRIMVLNVASSNKVKGEDVTTWRRVTYWDDSYRKMEQYLTKGASIVAIGEEMPPRIYESDGQHKASLEVTGKDLMFNPFGKKSESKDDDLTSVFNNTMAKPVEEEPRLPGLPPC